jgi:hypothetical protein
VKYEWEVEIMGIIQLKKREVVFFVLVWFFGNTGV